MPTVGMEGFSAQKPDDVDPESLPNYMSAQSRATLFNLFPFFHKIARHQSSAFAILVAIIGLAQCLVSLSGYLDEQGTRFKDTDRIKIDSLQLFLCICGAFMFATPCVQLIATAIRGRRDVSPLFLQATYAQSTVSIIAMAFFDDLQSGAQYLLVIAPLIGTTLGVDVRVLIVVWFMAAFAFTFHTLNDNYYHVINMAIPSRPASSIVAYLLASAGLLIIPQFLAYFVKTEQAQMAACDSFAIEVCELLADLNVQGAQRRIEEEQSRVTARHAHSSPYVISAASKLAQNLANFRAYVPNAILTDEFEESDQSDTEESVKGGVKPTKKGKSTIAMKAENSSLQTMGSVEKSLFRKRWSTVMYIEIFVSLNDAAKADYIASRVPEAIIPNVSKHRGVVDLLAPTAVIATFNCHIPCIIHESEACACALAIAAELNVRIPQVNFCISIASGYNFIGSCGTDQQRARVVVGETLNFALKVPSVARRHLGSRIIVSEDTASKIGYELAPIDNIAPILRGGEERMITIYEVRSNRKENAPASLVSLYNGAFSFLRGGDYVRAMELWREYISLNPEDLQAQRLMAISEGKTKALLRESIKPPTPYLRKELQWEPFDGEIPILRKIYEKYRSDNAAATLENKKAAKGPFDAGDSFTGPTGEDTPDSNAIGHVVRQQFLSNQRMEFQEDGLVPMFVMADSDEEIDAEPAVDGDMTNVGGPFNNDALSASVPRNFEDSYHNKWQRSDNIVGVGAFSQVYLALGEQGNLVAMKCFILANRQTRQEELIAEVETLSSLRNDYIVGYVSYAMTANHFIILMEYVSGGSLYQLLHQFGPLPAPAARRYLIDVLKGLRYLHENNTTHCDIKPHNVLLSNDGTCKLSDFGSSVSLMSQQQPEHMDQELVKGTSWYLAPEAARGDIRPANDIWSIGVTLLEVLTGKQPWEYTGGEANFIIMLGKDPTMVPPVPPHIQGPVRQFIERCLERDPAKRPTVHQLLLDPFLIG